MRAIVALVLASVPSLALRAQTPALDAAVDAMGGRERLLGVRTLVLEGGGTNLNVGQNHTPFAETLFEVTSLRRVYDFSRRRWFQDQTRVPRFVTANSAPQRQRIGFDSVGGGVAYGIAATDVVVRMPAGVASDRVHEFALHPVGFVQAAYAPGAERTEDAAGAGLRRVRITSGGHRYAMYVDTRTNLPQRIERMAHQPMLGDVAIVVELDQWQPVSGLQLPMRLTQKLDNLFTVAELRLTSATANGTTGDIAAPDSARTAAPPPAPAPPTIAIDSVTPGVWVIAGQTHHTVAIEQSNGIVLVEAPQSEARTTAAIEAARELRPDKPVALMVNTHHHFDHAGGLRGAIAQGLTIVTHAGNRDFYERVVFPRRHTIQPDRLAQNPKPLRLMPVSDRYVRADSLRPIEIIAVPSEHSGSMLVVYLPNERILIQADLYNPPPPSAVNPVFPFARALVDAVQQRGLAVDRVVGIHGRPVPWSEVVGAAR